jgi:hypothetical protein
MKPPVGELTAFVDLGRWVVCRADRTQEGFTLFSIISVISLAVTDCTA